MILTFLHRGYENVFYLDEVSDEHGDDANYMLKYHLYLPHLYTLPS